MAIRLLLAFAGLLVLLHALDLRDPRFALVSEFAFEQPLLTGVAFALLGSGIVAVGRDVLLAGRRRWTLLPAFGLAASGVGFALLAVVPTDHRGTVPATTATGRAHDALAGTSALMLTAATLLAWAVIRWRVAILVLLAVNLAFWLPAVLAPDWSGLFQRTWLGAVLLSLLPLVAETRRRQARQGAASPGSSRPPGPARA